MEYPRQDNIPNKVHKLCSSVFTLFTYILFCLFSAFDMSDEKDPDDGVTAAQKCKFSKLLFSCWVNSSLCERVRLIQFYSDEGKLNFVLCFRHKT